MVLKSLMKNPMLMIGFLFLAIFLFQLRDQGYFDQRSAKLIPTSCKAVKVRLDKYLHDSWEISCNENNLEVIVPIEESVIENMEKTLIIIDDDIPFRNRLAYSMGKKGFVVEYSMKGRLNYKEGKETEIFVKPYLDMKIDKEIKEFLKRNMYNHKKVITSANKGKRVINDLFKYLLKNPKKYISETKFKNEHKERVIADFVAGMTDRYAINLHKKIK